MVGVAGFEPTTSYSRSKHSTKLSYTPTESRRILGDGSLTA